LPLAASKHLTFRNVRLDADATERTDRTERWIDSKKPLLLHAENDDTHETGLLSPFHRFAGTTGEAHLRRQDLLAAGKGKACRRAGAHGVHIQRVSKTFR